MSWTWSERAAGLWTVREPLRFYGLPVGRWTTVIRLQDQRLWVHSPGDLTDATLREKLESVGEPAYFVCPGNLHNLHIAQANTHYPDARVYAPRSVVRRMGAVRFAGTLQDDNLPWTHEIHQARFEGHRLVRDFSFFHPPTKTLMLADLVFRFDSTDSLSLRVVARIGGVYERFGPIRPERWWFKDKAAAAASAKALMAWDFDRVIAGHGCSVDTGGHDELRRVFERTRLL